MRRQQEQNQRIATCAAAFIVMSGEYLKANKNREKRKRRWWMTSLYKSRSR